MNIKAIFCYKNHIFAYGFKSNMLDYQSVNVILQKFLKIIHWYIIILTRKSKELTLEQFL